MGNPGRPINPKCRYLVCTVDSLFVLIVLRVFYHVTSCLLCLELCGGTMCKWFVWLVREWASLVQK